MDRYATWDDGRLLLDREDPGASFAAFYRRHVHGVLAFFARRGVDAVRGAELTAATFEAALDERLGHRAGGSSPEAWLHAIAQCKLAFGAAASAPPRSRSAPMPVPLSRADVRDYEGLPGGPFDVLDRRVHHAGRLRFRTGVRYA
jgi:RNA polymerase sigma-70 factor (ECF subfamily)